MKHLFENIRFFILITLVFHFTSYTQNQNLINATNLPFIIKSYQNDNQNTDGSKSLLCKNYHNPAFLNMTLLDGYWAAKIVMSFTDEQLKTAIKQGQYSEPEVEEFLLQTLIKRRDKIGEYFFHRLNPLDYFTIGVNDDGNKLLSFKDLAVETGLESKEETTYNYQVGLISENKLIFLDERDIHSNYISFRGFVDKLYREFSLQNQNFRDFLVEISIRTNRGEKEEWSKPVKVYLSLVQEGKQFELIAIKRES